MYISAFQWKYPGIDADSEVQLTQKYYSIEESSGGQQGVEIVAGSDAIAIQGCLSLQRLHETLEIPPALSSPPSTYPPSLQISTDILVEDGSKTPERSSTPSLQCMRIPSSPTSYTTFIETLTDSEPSSPVIPPHGVLHTELPYSITDICPPPPTIGNPLTPDAFQREAFTARSAHPDPVLRIILNRILQSFFFLNGTGEPDIESEEGKALCAPNILGLIFAASEEEREVPMHGSVYLKFVDLENSKCLVCGNHRPSEEHLLECVRSDLGHLPYRCEGVDVGCGICSPTMVRFASRRQLELHIQQHAIPLSGSNLRLV
ncbi:hypothetical protein FRC14_007240 [Serendipita sp. 396]|nr:hypothetical protein FRC14_007240 [Serendipita sp. 396]KAG8771858.1 hypothetical protein FRC15_003126 [Serendipita sp. 397]